MKASNANMRSELKIIHAYAEKKVIAVEILKAQNNDMKSLKEALTSKLAKCKDGIGS